MKYPYLNSGLSRVVDDDEGENKQTKRWRITYLSVISMLKNKIARDTKDTVWDFKLSTTVLQYLAKNLK